jgi:hypothetical protein
MNHTITWVVNFSHDGSLGEKMNFFEDSTWIKYSNGFQILDQTFDSEINESVPGFFNDKIKYSFLDRFWADGTNFNSEKFCLIVIANRENTFIASRFAAEFKKSNGFLTDIGLPANSFKKSYLISFWEHSWSNTDYEKNIFGLYELSLFQNSTPISSRPFDSVFFYKNTNEGIGTFGNYYETNDVNFHSSSIFQLISYLSIAKKDSLVKDDLEKWARSFGGLLIYNDTEQINKINAEKISKLIFESIVKKDQGIWSIDYHTKKLDSHTNDLDCSKIFQNVTSTVSSTQEVEPLNFQNAWDWFGLEKLKEFFEKYISGVVFKTKEIKLNFVKKSYKEIKNKIDENLRKMQSEPDSLGISSPKQIFNSYFKHKPFSIESLRVGLGELINLIEAKRNGLLNFYSNGFKINDSAFFPFGLDEKSKIELDVLIQEFNGRDDFALIEAEKKTLNSINEACSTLPHPLSILSKNFILGTLLVMMAYVPVMSFLDSSFLVKILGYSMLSLLFIFPAVLGWYKYGNALRKISSERLKYEVLVKHNLSRRVNAYLFRKIDDFFDTYLKSCASFLSEIEGFQKFQTPQPSQEIEQNKDEFISIKPLSSIINEIPEVLVSIEPDGEKLKISELLVSDENVFKFYKNIVFECDLDLEKLLQGGLNELEKGVSRNMNNTIENSTNVATVIFGSKLNLKQGIAQSLLDVIPPYNGTEDFIKIEVIYASPLISVTDEIKNFLSPINVSNYADLSKPDDNPNELYIVSFNIPKQGVKSLFSLNLKDSFYDTTQNYFEKNKSRLAIILDFSYSNIVKYYGETLPDKFLDSKIRDSSLRHLLTSFDGGFDENFNNERVKFSKEFKEYNIEIIESKISEYLGL